MAATVTETPGSKYTWATATFAWNSTTAHLKTWDEAQLVAWGLTADDAVALSELYGTGWVKLFAESISFAELISKSYGLKPAEAMGIAESYIDNIAFRLNALENILLTEVLGKNFTLPVGDAFSLAELYVGGRALLLNEGFTLSDAWLSGGAFTQDFAEAITLTEEIAKTYGLKPEEFLNLLEEYIRRANAIISELMITSGDLTQEEFLDLIDKGSAAGYANFKPFLVGDHEYQKALFKEVFQTLSGDRPRLTELRTTVDVPDVIDRGEVTIPASSVTVSFNRTFLVPPEVTITLKVAPNTAIPKVTATSTTGFTVQVGNGVGGLVSATIGWTAHGY